MNYHYDELDNLKLGEIFLPAQIGTSRLEGGQKVVRVHYCVNECVQEGEYARIAAWCKFKKEPNGYGDREMVEHVEAAYLAILLSQYKTNRINELDDARQKEYVTVHDYLVCPRAAIIDIDWLAAERVEAIVEQAAGGHETSHVPSNHAQVVDSNEVEQFVWLAIAHEGRANHLDKPQVTDAHGHNWPWGSHEWIVG